MLLNDSVLGRRLTTHGPALGRLVLGYGMVQLAVHGSVRHPSDQLGQQPHLELSQRLVLQLTVVFGGGRRLLRVVMTTEVLISQSGRLVLDRCAAHGVVFVRRDVQEQQGAERGHEKETLVGVHAAGVVVAI